MYHLRGEEGVCVLIFLKYIESFGKNLFTNEAASERWIEERNKIAMLRREESLDEGRRKCEVGEKKDEGKTDGSSGYRAEGWKQREVYTA